MTGLLDRGLNIELHKMDKKERKLLRVVKRKYKALKPKLIAFCLDVIVDVLKEREKWRGIDDDFFGISIPNDLPRMADWAILGEQIARKIITNYEPGFFLKAFDENIEILNSEAIKESLVAQVIIDFMEKREERGAITGSAWEGTVTELLQTLETIIDGEKLKINVNKPPWVQSSSSLGKKTRR